MRGRLRHRLGSSSGVGRLPLGRLSIAVQVLAVAIFLLFSFAKMDVDLPLVSNPYTIEVEFANASGLDADDRPSVNVAGIALGRVTDVRFHDGRAVATLKLDSQARGRVFRDASAQIRPLSAINALAVNVLPGTPASGRLGDGGRIAAARSGTHVEAQQLIKELDVDTRAYLQIVLTEADAGLRGRAGELRSALERLGPLTDPGVRVASALAERRRLLARLVRELDVVFGEVALRGDRLTEAIGAGSETLAVTSARRPELEQTLRRLPPTLSAADEALVSGRRLSQPLVPALVDLRAAARPLPRALRRTRALFPDARALLTDVDALVRDGREPVRDLAEVTSGLGPIAAQAEPPVRRLRPILETLDERKEGIAQTSELLSGVVSRNDANGVLQRHRLFYEPPRPENFGRSRSSPRALLEQQLRRALVGVCGAGNSFACGAVLDLDSRGARRPSPDAAAGPEGVAEKREGRRPAKVGRQRAKAGAVRR